MKLTFLAVDSTLLKTHSSFIYIHIFYIHMSFNGRTEFLSSSIQDVTGGTDQTSGECSLGHTIPI